MCGLAGFSGASRQADTRGTVAAMLARIRHRGPDGEGIEIADDMAFGHVRLAIIDLHGGAQPRRDNGDGSMLIFNGEIYGYKALAVRLRADGVYLRDDSDTEVLFQMLRLHGIQRTLESIDGMFAFAFYEGKTGKLFLARDRFGEKPLFYGMANGVIAFASEVGALRRHPVFRDTGLDAAATARFLTLQYLPGLESGYRNIYKLAPGSFLEFHRGKINHSRYWRPVLNQGRGAAGKDADERLHEIETRFSDSVRERLIADVPVGVFLSGGLDSSLVAAFAAQHVSKLSAFSVRMQGESFDETPYARIVAEKLGITHEIVEFGNEDMLGAFDAVFQRLDEPMADASLLPTYLVCQAAKRSVTVALGGDGADELFAGYPNFAARRWAGLMSKFPKLGGAALRKGIDAIGGSQKYMSLGFKLKQLSYGFGFPPNQQSHQWMAAFSESEQRALWRPEAVPASVDGGLGDQVDAFVAESGCDSGFECLQHLFVTGYLPEDILTKVDRASMYNSLEVRAPFLARDFAEYALALPEHDKLKGSETKSMLKRLAEKYLPPAVVHRKKHGFAPPLAKMLQGSLKQRIEPILFDTANPVFDWFKRPEIERYWNEHQNGVRDHHRKLWTLAVLMRVAYS